MIFAPGQYDYKLKEWSNKSSKITNQEGPKYGPRQHLAQEEQIPSFFDWKLAHQATKKAQCGSRKK